MSDYGVSRLDRFELEKPLLGPLPQAYQMFEWKEAKVHPDCCIELQRSVYSVPFIHVGKFVRVKFNEAVVIILDESGTETLATHVRQPKFKSSILDEHLPAQKVQRSSFNVKRVEQVSAGIGPKTLEYVQWQFESDRYPLRVLRRMQGLIRFYETSQMSKDALEFAATRALSFQRRDLRYFTDCAKMFKPGKENLRLVSPPQRESSHIHLQS